MSKIYFITFLSIFLYANEADDINSIVLDIQKLKLQKNKCNLDAAKVDSKYKECLINAMLIKDLKKDYKKEKEILKLKNKMIDDLKQKLALQKSLLNKHQKVKKNIQKNTNTKKPTEKKHIFKEIKIKPTTYRLNKDAYIYDGVNGKKIDKWEKRTSFTTYIITDNDWIKITGYFVNRKWQKAKRDLWVKKEDTMPH